MRFFVPASRGAVAALITASMLLALGAAVPAACADEAPAAAAPKDTVRAEVGKPLQAAQALMKDRKFKDALAKIHEAEAVANRTPYENFVIDQMRGSAAANDGQDDVAASSYESVVASGRLAPADQLRTIQAIAVTYYNKLKNYTKAASWATRYLKDGGTDPTMQDLLINSYYLNKDYATAAAELKGVAEADEKAGRTTTEQHLQILLSCYESLGNGAGSGAVLEKLLENYPKKDYWALAISHLVHRTGFADRLELDLLRLELALGELKREGDFMEMAMRSMEAGFPSEAKKVIDQAYAAGIFGKGAEAERQKRLQAKANKDSADDLKSLGAGDADAEKAKSGDGMVNTGFNYVLNGKAEKGLPLMEQGLRKGGLKHPEDAKLHLGIAYIMAGDKAKAVQTLRTVQGNDGTADLAHLWAVYAGGKR
jgi:hypothetical protein